ncbi:MAG: glycosyltransferase family 39 protein [Actinomycetota bacterium]|nr:glycosyltransferase family 39 protein [Actinomycetota bacterium]
MVRERDWDKVAIGALVVGAVLRLVLLWLHPPLDYVYSDMYGYVERARALVGARALTPGDAFYPPGTHMLLAAPMLVFGSGRSGLWGGASLWWLLSALTPFFMWRLARLFFSRATAALSAALCALWPLLITSGGFFSSETPATALLVGALWWGYAALRTVGWRAAGVALAGGLMAGGAIAVRPQLALNIGVMVVPALAQWRRTRRVVVALLVGTAVVLAGALAHNAAAVGRVTGLSHNAGLNFFTAHCPVSLVRLYPSPGVYYVYGAPSTLQLHRGHEYSFVGHSPWDEWFFYGQGFRCIDRNPAVAALVSVRNVIDMTATSVPWPQSNEVALGRIADITNVGYSLALVGLGVGGLTVVRRRRGTTLGAGVWTMLAHLACLVPVGLLFVGDPRYRIPYDVFGLALIAVVLTRWLGLGGSGKDRPPVDPRKAS